MSCDGLLEKGLRRIWHRKFWTMEERGWRRGAVWNVHLVGGHSTNSTAGQLCSVFGWGGESSSVCRCVHRNTCSHTHKGFITSLKNYQPVVNSPLLFPLVSLFTKTILIVYEDFFIWNVSWSLKPAKWHTSCTLCSVQFTGCMTISR